MSFGLFYIYSFKALVKTLNNLVPNISKCFCFFLVYRSGKGWILLTHRKPRLKHLICYSLNSSGSWYCPWTDCRAWSGATASDQAPKARDVPSRERECPQGSMRHYQVQLLREIWKLKTPCGGFATIVHHPLYWGLQGCCWSLSSPQISD